MAKPSKFAHIVYRTRRFEEMTSWYERVFEAKVQYKNPALAFLTYDEEHHRFAFTLLAYTPRSNAVTLLQGSRWKPNRVSGRLLCDGRGGQRIHAR
jgi:catechol 2,3-dioxygenase-like lactoylglutathione lyase family enzyme